MPQHKPEHFSDVFRKHNAALEAISRELAMNFDAPAQRLINVGFSNMGIARFTRSGDDLWEMYIAHRDETDYERPSRALVNRWAAY